MKRQPIALSVSLLLAAGAAALRAEGPSTWRKAADNHIYAQLIVSDILANNPELYVVGVHAVALGDNVERLVATNLDRIGKQDDDDDLAVANEGKTIMAPNLKETDKFEVATPLKTSDGTIIGSINLVFKYKAGDDEVAMLRKTHEVRDAVAQKIASKADLYIPVVDGKLLAVPGPLVRIPGAGGGKYDFLEVDSVNHRLLASHEKMKTAEFIDLDTNRLDATLPTGPAVCMALAPEEGKYYVSDSDEQNVAIVDAASLKPVGTIRTPGDLDEIMYEPKNGRIYATNDEGAHVWAIDPKTDRIVGDTAIPAAPEYMVYDAAADRLYLNIKPLDEVVTIDPSTNAVVATWTTAPADKPHGLAFDAETGRLFSAGANGVLAVIDVRTGKVVGTATIATGVDQIAFDPDSKRIYCASADAMSVVQETGDGARLLGNLPTADTAKNVAVDPKTHAVWTTYVDGKDAYAKSWLLP